MSVDPGNSQGQNTMNVSKPFDTVQADKIERNLRGIDAAVAASNLKIVLRLGEEVRRRTEAFPRESLERGILQSLTNILKVFESEANAVDLALRVMALFGGMVNLSGGDSKQDIPLAILLRPEGVSAIVNAAQRHLLSVHIHSLVGQVFHTLVTTSDGARMLVDAKAHSLLIQRLPHFAPSSLNVTNLYCATLAKLCQFYLGPRKLFIREQKTGEKVPSDVGSDPAITNVMALLSAGIRNPSSLAIQANICCCLANVATTQQGCASVVAVPEAVRYAFVVLKQSQPNEQSDQGLTEKARNQTKSKFATFGASAISAISSSANSIITRRSSAGKSSLMPSIVKEDTSLLTMQNEVTQDEDVALAIAMNASLVSDEIQVNDDVPWICHACTFQNDASQTDQCAMCETPKRLINTRQTESSKEVTLSQSKEPQSAIESVSQLNQNHISMQKKEHKVQLSDEERGMQVWSAVLVHNMCVFATDLRARSYLQEEFASSCHKSLELDQANQDTSATEIVQKIYQRINKLCSGTKSTHDNGLQANLLDIDISKASSEELVDLLVDPQDPTSPETILFQHRLLATYWNVSLSEIIQEAVKRLIKLLSPAMDINTVGPLPLNESALVLLQLILTWLQHPALRKNLASNNQNVLNCVFSNDPRQDSLMNALGKCFPHDAFHGITKYLMEQLVGGETQCMFRLKTVPYLPYRSVAADSNSRVLKSQGNEADGTHTVSYSSVVLTPFAQAMGSINQLAQSALPDQFVPTESSQHSTEVDSKQPPLTSDMMRVSSQDPSHSDSSTNDSLLSISNPNVTALSIAMQMSLRLQQLYVAIDPCFLIEYCTVCSTLGRALTNVDVGHTNKPDENGVSTGICQVIRFLDECKKITLYFEAQVLAGETPLDRALVLSKVIDIAHIVSGNELSNSALAMCCMEALDSAPIRRLELTWRNIGINRWEVFNRIRQKCGIVNASSFHTASSSTEVNLLNVETNKVNFENDGEVAWTTGTHSSLSVYRNPTTFATSSRIPYLPIILDIILQQYVTAQAITNGSKVKLGAAEILKKSWEPNALGTKGMHRRYHSLDSVPPKREMVNNSNYTPSEVAVPLFSRHISLETAEEQNLKQEGTVTSRITLKSTVELMNAIHNIVQQWLPTAGLKDWHPRMYRITPNPHVQMELKRLKCTSNGMNETIFQVSIAKEPSWSLQQMLLESLYAVEALLEGLFDNPKEEEGAQMVAFRSMVLATSNKHPKDAHTGSLTAGKAGAIISQLVSRITSNRRTRLLAESGARGSQHWESVVKHVRLCVERLLLAPVYSRLVLTTMTEFSEQECALQERLELLRALGAEKLCELLACPDYDDGNDNSKPCMWYAAVAALRAIDIVDLPTLKVQVLLEVKDEIFNEAQRQLGMKHMAADDFLPVMTFVVIQAQLRHPWSTIKLVRQLLGGDKFSRGEAAYYLTTVEIALDHLMNMEIPK